MHPRSPYLDPPDFRALAEYYLPLKAHLISAPTGVTLNFKDEAAQEALTLALLKRDFQLEVQRPKDRLCPAIPNRLNYILWLQDVANAVTLAMHALPERPVRGLDIGTGAIAVYPLLGCRVNPTWSFTATDIDDWSLESSRRNIQHNDLQGRVELIKVDPNGPIFLPLHAGAQEPFEFTMCNPPFYTSREEVVQSAEAKEFDPHAVCTGADVEMITEGGEAAFVGRMVHESLQLRTRCRWFTSMLGKMSTLRHIVGLLRENQVDNYAISNLVQGQTRRWVIAWSFGDIRLPDSTARVHTTSLHALMPPHNTLHLPLPPDIAPDRIRAALSDVLSAIGGLTLTQSPLLEEHEQMVHSIGNTWSRAARRKNKGAEADAMAVEPEVRMVCRVRVERARGDGTEDGVELVLTCEWLKGSDRPLFESFASHLGRKVGLILSPE